MVINNLQLYNNIVLKQTGVECNTLLKQNPLFLLS